MNQQFNERRPVSLLKPQRNSEMNEDYLNLVDSRFQNEESENALVGQMTQIQKQMLEQSYLWDWDQQKDSSKIQQLKINQIKSIYKKNGSQSQQDNSENNSQFDEKSRESLNDSSKNSLYQNERDFLSFQQDYFTLTFESNLEQAIQKAKSKVKKNQGISVAASNIINSLSSYFQKSQNEIQKKKQEEELLQKNQQIARAKESGKKIPEWTDITCCCSFQDIIILGFGNGSIISIDTSDQNQNITLNKCISYHENFSDYSIDKMKIVFIQKKEKSEYLLLSLTNEQIICNLADDIEKRIEILDKDKILDFEPYQMKRIEENEWIGYQYFLAVLQMRKLEIFKYKETGENKSYVSITKVVLQFMNVNPQLNEKNYEPCIPIFDGGIVVHNDVFIIQYKNKAEYVRIQNKGIINQEEVIINLKLWDDQVLSSNKSKKQQIQSDDDELQDERRQSINEEHKGEEFQYQMQQQKARSYTQQEFAQKTQQFIQKNLVKNKYQYQKMPATPVFDEFLQAFILTKNDKSFYMDLNGNYDTKFRSIQWSNKVQKIQMACPFIIGFLQNSKIEVRNIFNPNKIIQELKLLENQTYVTSCISQNLLNQYKGRLDDFYVIYKSKQDLKSYIGQQKQIQENENETYKLLKFKQQNADIQLSIFHKNKLYSTCLKFVDFLHSKNLKGGLSEEIYLKILRQKAFYNFIVLKRFYVTKEIVWRSQIPLEQVIALFQFIYPEAYFQILERELLQSKEISNFKLQKRIRIYQYFIEQSDKNKKTIELIEDKSMLEEMRKKVDYNSQLMVIEFNNRQKPGKDKDPYYKSNKQIINPSSQLQSDELDSLRIFLPYFLKQRIFLRRYCYFLKDEEKAQKIVLLLQKNDPVGTNFSWETCKNLNKQYNQKQCMILLQFVEMIIFHSLIILISSKRAIDVADHLYFKKEFFELIQTDYKHSKNFEEEYINPQQNQEENLQNKDNQIEVSLQLPYYYCMDILFKYRDYDTLCKLLFYRGQYDQLLQLTRWGYEEQKKICNELKKQLGDSYESNQIADKQLNLQKKYRNEWFYRFIEYIQKINDVSKYETSEQIEEAEKYCADKSEWVLKENDSSWVDCFKKWSNLDSKLQAVETNQLNNSEQNEIGQPTYKILPFMSEQLLQKLQTKGNSKCFLKYFEYLTLKCNVPQKDLHTRLACLYIRYIQKLALKDQDQITINIEELKKDPSIVDLKNKLRYFLTQSQLYESITVETFLNQISNKDEQQKQDNEYENPLVKLLLKELAILKMKQGKFKECYEICIEQLNDLNFAQSLAKRGFNWHQQDRRIWYGLFKILYMQQQQENKKQAIKILAENSEHITFEKITKNFIDEDEFDQDINSLYKSLFEKMNQNMNKQAVLCQMTELQINDLIREQFRQNAKFIEIIQDEYSNENRNLDVEYENQIYVCEKSEENKVTVCSECQKPISGCAFQYDPIKNTLKHSNICVSTQLIN